MRSPRKFMAFGSALLVLTVGAAPFLASAADHLDAPSLGSLSAGSLQGDRDINDVYVFQGANASRTVIAATVSPAAGLLGPLTFGSNVRYSIKIDNNANNVADVTYVLRFGAPGSGPDGKQTVTVARNGTTVGTGHTGNTTKLADGKLWTGVRSDPFFFDLLGFRGTLGLGPNTNTLCDATPSDFFASLNTLAMVIEVPDAALGTSIGVWATTEQWINGAWVARDQMGRPAINTVFNSTAADKEQFNRTAPAVQATVDGGKFRNNVIAVLQALSGATDTEGAYSAGQAGALASVLIPDVITYDTRTAAVGPLNGRALADDVIDVELNITTGGDPLGLFADRDATGGVPSDCVGRHSDYLASWPYLGLPH